MTSLRNSLFRISLAGLVVLAVWPSRPVSARQVPGQETNPQTGAVETDTTRVVDPGAALLRSAVIPGWGQFYTRHPVKGVLMIATQATFVGMAVRADNRVKDLAGQRSLDPVPATLEDDIEEWRSERRTWIIRAFFLWLYSMADAYVDAHLYDFEEVEPQFVISICPNESRYSNTQVWCGITIPLGFPDR